MAFYRVLVLRSILGTAVFLGSAAAAISNKERIADFFSKNKGKDKNKKTNEASGGTAVSGTATTEESKDTSTDQKAATGGGADKSQAVQTGEQGASAPTTTTPDGTGGGTGQTPSAGGTEPKAKGPGATTGEQGTGSPSGAPGVSSGGTTDSASTGGQAAGGGAQTSPTSSEIDAINTKISTNLGLPESCKFDASNANNYTKECDVTKDQLQKVNFLGKTDNQNLTISNGETSNLKLEIKRFNKPTDDDKKRYGKDIKENDLRFTFKEIKQKIEIKNGDKAIFILEKNTNPEFEIYPSNGNSNTGKLGRSWYPASLGFKVGLSCDFGTSGTCKPRNNNHDIKLFEGNEIKNIKVENGDKSKEIKVTDNQGDFNQGYKFNVSKEISGEGSSDKLATGDYEIKYIDDKKEWALSKVTVASQTI